MLTSSGRRIASLAPRGPAGSVAIVRGAPILLCLRHLADALDRPSGHTGRKPMRRRTLVFIGVLAVVLIGGVALGVRNLSDAFADRPDGSSQRVTANGWVAYVVPSPTGTPRTDPSLRVRLAPLGSRSCTRKTHRRDIWARSAPAAGRVPGRLAVSPSAVSDFFARWGQAGLPRAKTSRN